MVGIVQEIQGQRGFRQQERTLGKGNLETGSRQQKRVLIVEDNKESQVLVMKALEGMDCQFLWAHDGYQAVESLLNTSRIDLVVLDWMMPGLDGHDVLSCLEKCILRDPSLEELPWAQRPLPYAVYTALSPEQVQIPPTSHFQCVGFWHKPITPSEVRCRVMEIFSTPQI